LTILTERPGRLIVLN